jgi:hypothetical protein
VIAAIQRHVQGGCGSGALTQEEMASLEESMMAWNPYIGKRCKNNDLMGEDVSWNNFQALLFCFAFRSRIPSPLSGKVRIPKFCIEVVGLHTSRLQCKQPSLRLPSAVVSSTMQGNPSVPLRRSRRISHSSEHESVS